MKLSVSRLLNGALAGLTLTLVAVACGSDDPQRTERTNEGGEGGALIGEPNAGQPSTPEPVGGGGGNPLNEGGAPNASAGSPPLEGGAPPALAGAGGEGGAEPLPLVDCSSISFADPGLTNAVLAALFKTEGDTITPEEAAGITDLHASGLEISDLAGIECLTGLETLGFGAGGAPSAITDLRPLLYLKSLKSLDLNSNPLDDLSVLGQLPKLQTLDLSRAIDGADLSPLANSTSLVKLNVFRTTLGDLTPLSEIPTLSILDLSDSTLNEPTTLGTLRNIKELTISEVADAATLGELTQLTHLDLYGTVPNPDLLATLVNLTYFYAYDIGLTSLTPLANMTKLVELQVQSNAITDLAPLANLLELQRLTVSNNPITSLAPLVANSGIGTDDVIFMYGTEVTCSGDKASINALRARGVTLNGPPTCP